MHAAPAAPDTFQSDEIRFLDACNDECLGMQPSFNGGNVDPRTFFVGEDAATDLAGELDSEKNNDLMLPGIADIMAGSPTGAGAAPTASDVGRWENFPAIPEHAELHMQPAAMKHDAAAFMSTSPMSSIDPFFLTLSNNTSSTSTPSDAMEELTAVGGFPFNSHHIKHNNNPNNIMAVPRVVSMPNLHFFGTTTTPTLTTTTTATAAPTAAAAGPGPSAHFNSLHAAGSSTDLRRQALAHHRATTTAGGGGVKGMPRSKSASDVMDVSTYEIPHIEYLTPAHMRKGKGGRQPAADPRLDPKIDAKKARRILANRLSAARSKLKQKSAMETLRQKVDILKAQKDGLSAEVGNLTEMCSKVEAERQVLHQQVSAAENHLTITRVMGKKLQEAANAAAAGVVYPMFSGPMMPMMV